MSAIFGLRDARASRGELLAACQGIRPVGEASIIEFGAWVVGYVDDGTSGSVHEHAGTITVACGRMHGLVDDPLAEAGPDQTSAEILSTTLARHGVAGLSNLAGDYACAQITHHEMLLVRDAFGMRPLYWSRDATRMAFASDPRLLARLGFVGGLDAGTLGRYLDFRAPRADRTALQGVRQVVGGRWVRIRAREAATGRWFRPEEVAQDDRLRGAAAQEMFADRLEAAVRSRASGRVCLSLSAGRDSGAVAATLGAIRADATAVTLLLEGDPHSDERRGARELAEGIGLPWSVVTVPSSVSDASLASVVGVLGPTTFPAFPLATTIVDEAARQGARVLMDGTGGEPVFSASPVVVLDLFKQGRPRAALASARTFDARWTSPLPTVVKSMVRAVAPGGLLQWRERRRPQAPWVSLDLEDRTEIDAPRSARGHLLDALMAYGRSESNHQFQDLATSRGMEYSAPLLDLRLVDLALRVPDVMRAPVPHPKPLYAKVLGRFDSTRIKAVQTTYFDRLARQMQRDQPWCFDPGGVLASTGAVRVQSLHAVADDRWRIQSLPLGPLAAWLRLHEEA